MGIPKSQRSGPNQRKIGVGLNNNPTKGRVVKFVEVRETRQIFLGKKEIWRQAKGIAAMIRSKPEKDRSGVK